MFTGQSNQENYVDQNNIGIWYLRRGMFDEAIQAFRRTISKIFNGLQQDTNMLLASSRNCLNISEKDELEINAISCMMTGEGCFFYTDHNTIVLHTCSFHFSDSTSASGTILEGDPRMMSDSPFMNTIMAIILFNLGLSYHLRSASPAFHQTAGESTTGDMERRKAQQMYWKAERLLCRRQDDLEDMKLPRQTILMAVCNNLAHLSFHSFDISETEIQLRKLRFLLSIRYRNILQDSEEDRQEEATDDGHYEHFLWNEMSHRVLPPTSPAA